MGKVQFNKDYKNYRLSIVENDVITTYKVADMFGDDIEYSEGILPVADGKKYYDMTNNGIHFIYNLDLPAKVEAENLKSLRRSSALKNIFHYDKNKKFDFIGFMPWLIIILLVLFK